MGILVLWWAESAGYFSNGTVKNRPLLVRVSFPWLKISVVYVVGSCRLLEYVVVGCTGCF